MNTNHNKARNAYILQIHKNPEQVNMFIKQIIFEDQGDVFIHIDKKHYHEIREKIIDHPNVFVVKNSIDVKWGDITQVDATIILLREVLATGKNYDFVCFRSGQDLLVKNGFSKFLSNNQGKIYMNAYHVKTDEPHAAFANVHWPKAARKLYINPFHPNRILRRAIMCLYGFGLNIMPNRNRLPDFFSLYNGSNWFCYPLEVAKYTVDFIDSNNWFYEAFQESLCPDEFFFQTLIMNSPFQSKVVNNNLMYIKFGETFKSRNNPITLKMEHINIINNSNQFFARKFDQNVDNPVIEYFTQKVKI